MDAINVIVCITLALVGTILWVFTPPMSKKVPEIIRHIVLAVIVGYVLALLGTDPYTPVGVMACISAGTTPNVVWDMVKTPESTEILLRHWRQYVAPDKEEKE